MKLILLYTVLVSIYGSDEIVGECDIYENSYDTTCTVNGKAMKGVLDHKGLIWAHSSDESIVLKPRGEADKKVTANTSGS
ncbi:MAG: hypothetical protein AAF304_08210 [Pseudomonadota bacterium]